MLMKLTCGGSKSQGPFLDSLNCACSFRSFFQKYPLYRSGTSQKISQQSGIASDNQIQTGVIWRVPIFTYHGLPTLFELTLMHDENEVDCNYC